MRFRHFISLALIAGCIFVIYRIYKEKGTLNPQTTVEQRTEEEPSRQNMSGGFLILTCPACEGSGKFKDQDVLRTCHVCNGFGSRKITPLKSNEKICGYCGGMGKVLYVSNNKTASPSGYAACSFCKGRGVIRTP
jgi:hypothetical protein